MTAGALIVAALGAMELSTTLVNSDTVRRVALEPLNSAAAWRRLKTPPGVQLLKRTLRGGGS